jgi:hypothetical protein
MECKICGNNSFDKDGRIWTCKGCGSEHVMSKDLRTVTSVHSTRKSSKYNINIGTGSNIFGMCIGDNAQVTQVVSGGGVRKVTQIVIGD